MTIPDTTKVLEIEPDRKLVLEVRARPIGRGKATFIIEPHADDSGEPMALVTLEEVPIGSLAPLSPLLDPLISSRNIASLNALVALLNSPGRAPAKAAQAGGEHDATSA